MSLNLIIWLLLFGLTLTLHVVFFKYAEDDAFIHFRIANNLVKFGVPYYNINEPVMASSAPIWTLVIGTVFKVITTNLYFVSFLNSILTVSGAFVYAQLLKKPTSGSLPIIYLWLFATLYIAILLQSSIGLMETPLALLLLGIAFLLLANSDPRCLLFFGLAVFTRMELVVFWLGAIVFFAVFKRSTIKGWLPWLLIGILPAATFVIYFGHSLVPNTILAKQIAYQLAPIDVLKRIVPTLFPTFTWGRLTWDPSSTQIYLYFAFLVSLYLIAIGVTERRKEYSNRKRFLTYFILLGGIAILSTYTLRSILIFDWYVPLYAIPLVFAFYQITLLQKTNWVHWMLLLALVPWFAFIAGSFGQVILAAARQRPEAYPNFYNGARVRAYLSVGEQLYNTFPDAVLLTSEIGGLGYSFHGEIADGLGLVSPLAMQFHPMKVPEERSSPVSGAIPVGFVNLVNPEIIVSYDLFDEAFRASPVSQQYVALQAPSVLEDDRAHMGNLKNWELGALRVFVRRDVFAKHPIAFLPAQ